MDPILQYKKVQDKNLKRITRLSIQYSIAGIIFTALSLWQNEPRYSIAVLVILILSSWTRIRNQKNVNKTTRKILEKEKKLAKK